MVEKQEALAREAVSQEACRSAHSILRLPSVKARTGLSRSTIYLKVSECSFPKPIALGTRAVGWIEAEINAWLSQRIHASRTVITGKPL